MLRLEKKKGLVAAIIVLLILVIDQIIKIEVKTNMCLHDYYRVTDWFYIYFTENNGPTNLNCHYKVEVDDNLTSVQRITRLTFTKDGAELGHCYVLQKPKPRIGVYFPQGKTFPASGGTLIARVFCNTDWYASAYGSWTGFDWVTCEKVDDMPARRIGHGVMVG